MGASVGVNGFIVYTEGICSLCCTFHGISFSSYLRTACFFSCFCAQLPLVHDWCVGVTPLRPGEGPLAHVNMSIRGTCPPVQISGRLNGAEIARSEWIKDGRMPF